MSHAPPAPAPLTDHYEVLRGQALSPSATSTTGRGLAVLLQRGMSAWLTVCQELLSRGDEGYRPRPVPSTPAAARLLPADAGADLVRALAGMALAVAEGRRA